jgi:hypothetical protein
MPRATRGINTLPEPTWTQSDNNLLPKWMKFLEWQRNTYGNEGIRHLQEGIAQTQLDIASYDRSVREYNDEIKRVKEKLAALTKKGDLTDAEIMQRYEALIASPHVIGTRVDWSGALVVLIDPQIKKAKQLELGMYELDVRSLKHGRHTVVLGTEDSKLIRLIRYVYNVQEEYYGEAYSLVARFNLSTDACNGIDDYDLLPAIEDLISKLAYMYSYCDDADRLAKKTPDRAENQPWSGFVDDPVRAIRRMRRAYGASNVAQQIDALEYRLRDYQYYKQEHVSHLKTLRKQLRDQQAELTKLEAVANLQETDHMEAVRSLEFISTLPSVIAIKFGADGVPIVHVRNSFVHKGRRFDLGDFEVSLKLERVRFGTVPVTRRTRCPLGGSYDQGWHPTDNAFCFGNRTSEMLDAFYAGDMNHMFNLILGTMNGIDAGDGYLVEDGAFAEIAMDDVWQRKLRRRPRRTTTKPDPVAA